MGTAKHTRISQRMSQHIMQMKLALRISTSESIQTYQVGMFIPQGILFVNTFLSAKPFAGVLAVSGL